MEMKNIEKVEQSIGNLGKLIDGLEKALRLLMEQKVTYRKFIEENQLQDPFAQFQRQAEQEPTCYEVVKETWIESVVIPKQTEEEPDYIKLKLQRDDLIRVDQTGVIQVMKGQNMDAIIVDVFQSIEKALSKEEIVIVTESYCIRRVSEMQERRKEVNEKNKEQEKNRQGEETRSSATQKKSR